MYSIKSNSRRITTFVKNEAYKWLYDKINKNEYEVKNKREAQQLILSIQKAQCVTESSYNKFVEYIIHNPFSCVMSGYKRKSNLITTRKIENFFVLFNGTPLPIGFIKDFFEDDYETQAEINKYIASIVKEQENLFAIKAQERVLAQNENITRMKTTYRYFFKTNVLFHLTNVIKMLLTIVTFFLCVYYFKENDVIGKVIIYLRDGEGEKFIEDNMFLIIFNIIVFFCLIPRIIKLVKLIIFYIIWFITRFYVFLMSRSLFVFENKKIEEMREYNKSIVPEIATRGYIDDSVCSGMPSVRRLYLRFERFNYKKVESKIDKIGKSPKFNFVNLFYQDEVGLKVQKKKWKSRIVTSVLLAVVLMFTNIKACRDFAIDLYNEALANITGESVDVSVEESLELCVGKTLFYVKKEAENLDMKLTVYIEGVDVTTQLPLLENNFITKKVDINKSEKTVKVEADSVYEAEQEQMKTTLSVKLPVDIVWETVVEYATQEHGSSFIFTKQLAELIYDGESWMLIGECSLYGIQKNCMAIISGTRNNQNVVNFEIF